MRSQSILLAIVFLLAGTVSAALALYLAAFWDDAKPAPQAPAVTTVAATPPAAAPKPAEATAGELPKIDFMRIASSGGVSVLAGRARPKSFVTLFANGQPFASVEADGNGEWSLATEHPMGTGEPAITIAEGRLMPPPAAVASKSTSPGEPRTVTAVEQQVLRNLEKALAALKAPKPVAPEEPAKRVASAGTAVPTATDTPPSAAAAPPQAADEHPKVPITFVYRESRPTPLGDKAARLLAEYVRARGISYIELTGHADERGTDEFNMALSQQRLDAVAQLLRSVGYTGELKLVPRGKSEPYLGVDRTKLAVDDLYQLDRRVELRVAR